MGQLPSVTRAQLSRALNNETAVVRAVEALLSGVRDAPDEIEQAQQTADQAVEDAATAQNAADAAGTAALNAQTAVNTLSAVPFVTIGASPATANERTLAVDPLGLSLTDGGPNNPVTIARADLVSVLGADVSDSTAAFVNAGTLALNLVAGATYLVEALVTFQAAATTTGLALGFALPAGATISGMFQHNTTATALEGSYNIAAGAVKGNTTGVLVATENAPVQGSWLIKTDVTAGAAQLLFRSEVAASAVTLKAGLSALIARRLA